VTCDHTAQLDGVFDRYIYRITAAEHILKALESEEPLPVPQSATCLISPQTNYRYQVMLQSLKQRVKSQAQVAAEESDHDVAAVAAAASSSGSRGASRGQKRNRDEPEYPKWEFQGGKTKKTWQAYDQETNQLLESAFQRKRTLVDFVIDGWDYTVNFHTGLQMSHETGSVRSVRRLADPSSCPPQDQS